MIRLIQRRLIIPRGDTGTFTIPVVASNNTGDVAVFTIFSEMTKKKIYEKIVAIDSDTITVEFAHGDTVNLPVGKYVWDIKFYKNPVFVDDVLVNGDEIDSYYAAFTLPVCEIRQTGDTLLTADDAPTATIAPEYLNIVNAAISETLHNKNLAAESAAVAETSAANASSYLADTLAAKDIAEARVNEIENLSVEVNTSAEGSDASVSYTPATGVLSFEIPRGDTGNGIASCVLNADFTLTINYTDGTSLTTIPIRGDTPHLTIGEVTEGPNAIATITGTDANPILNLTLPNANVPKRVSQLENDSNYAVDSNYVHTDNNYTTAEKEKLAGIAAGAEVNVNADWNAASGDAQILNKPTKVSDFTNDAGYLTEHQDISGKADKSEIPTKVSQLQNDSGYLTSFTETDPTVPAWAKAAQKPSYTAAEVGAPTVQEMNSAISTAIGNVNSFDMAVVQQLPTTNISPHTIYLVPKTGETNDVYDEYIYINNAWEMVGNTQVDLSDYVQKTDYATADNAGIIKIGLNSGLVVSVDGSIVVSGSVDSTIKSGANARNPITPKYQHTSTFYGLAKAAGDTTQSQSNNAVGTYTDEAKAAIRTMIGAPALEDIPDAPVQDVQVNGVSILQDGVANVPIGSQNTPGVFSINANNGITKDSNGKLVIQPCNGSDLKTGTNNRNPVTPLTAHTATFYGLAKAAGADMKDIANTTVGTYPDAQKEAIQSMLGITQMLAPENPNLVASQPYSIGDVFAANGKLYKATAAIAQDGAIIPDTNCVETTMADESVRDVQIDGTSVVSGDVANVPVATDTDYGVVKVAAKRGIFLHASGQLSLNYATSNVIKKPTGNLEVLIPYFQHEATFYGLSKVAGVDLANETVTLGIYPEASKTAIKTMLGVQDGLKVVRLI